MKRNVLLWGAVAAFGAAVIVAGVGDAGRAVACDKNASQSASATPSCCAQGSATTADAGKVHGAVIRSAVVAPGAAPVLNVAALGGSLAAGDHAACPWCAPGTCNSAGAAAAAGCPAFATASTGAGCQPHSAAMNAATCEAHKAAMAASSGCRASNAAAGTKASGSSCCANKTASAAACEKQLESAAIKDAVDEIPYRENKRLVLTGNYACAHCALKITAGCAPMFKTADGKVYPLMKGTRAADLRKAGVGNSVEVSVLVRKIDGVKYLDVKSFKTI